MSFIPKVLIIAGSDSGGGAGIQADIKTTSYFKGYAMTAVTAITAQNTTGVKSITKINPKKIEEQILFTCKDIYPDAIKIGMLSSSEVIKSVLTVLKIIKLKKIILGNSFFASFITLVCLPHVPQNLFHEFTTTIFPSFCAFLKTSILKVVFFSTARASKLKKTNKIIRNFFIKLFYKLVSTFSM